jgi:elongation factor 1-alpha
MTIGLAHKKLLTSCSAITVADAPGHREFVANMLRGAATSDAAVLVVAVDEGIQEQCRQHLLLCETFGIRQLLVVVNKMDLVHYAQEPFVRVRSELRDLLARHGYDETTPILPCSALEGENIATRSERMPWADGACLLDALESLHVRAAPATLPLRLPVQDVYPIDNVAVVVGRIETGELSTGQAVVAASGLTSTVARLQLGDAVVENAVAGDNVYVWFQDPIALERGDVVGSADAATLPGRHSRVRCTLALLEGALEPGREYTLRVHTAETPARVEAIDSWIDPETGVRIDGAPANPTRGEVCDVRLALLSPLHLTAQNELPQLARVSLLDDRLVLAEGLCTDAGPTA